MSHEDLEVYQKSYRIDISFVSANHLVTCATSIWYFQTTCTFPFAFLHQITYITHGEMAERTLDPELQADTDVLILDYLIHNALNAILSSIGDLANGEEISSAQPATEIENHVTMVDCKFT